jgi:hypothetical protein
MTVEVPAFSYVFSHPASLGIGFGRPMALLLLLGAPMLFALGRKKFPRATIQRITAFIA